MKKARYDNCAACKFVDLDSMNPETGQPTCRVRKTVPSDYSHAERLMRKGGIMAICQFSPYRETMLKRLERDCIGIKPM